jgi:hypothetical protein
MNYANWQSSKESESKKYGKFVYQERYGSPSKENIEKIIGNSSIVSNQVKLDIIPGNNRNDLSLFKEMEKPLGTNVIKEEPVPYNMQREFTVIRVLSNGKYYLNGKMCSLSELDFYLDSMRHYKGEFFVVIIYDGDELKSFANDAGTLCDSVGIINYKILDLNSMFTPSIKSRK